MKSRAVKALGLAAGAETKSSSNRPTEETAPHASRPVPQPGEPVFAPSTHVDDLGMLGSYRVIRKLGQGGMGAVYLVYDTRLEREAALKVMLPAYARDDEAKERFLREARAAAKVAHDNVVTIYDFGETDGMPYIAMQFLKGASLDEYLKKKKPPSLSQSLRIARETACGLAVAHKLGMVHRDVKPANIWLEAPNGRVKLLDFGLAKTAIPGEDQRQLTQTGDVIGTPAYMSPEQARGEKLDGRSDLFSLGSVLHRLLAGELPFRGSNMMAMLSSLALDEPKPLRSMNPDAPEAVERLLKDLMAKKPEDRIPSAEELVSRIRTIEHELAGQPSATEPVAPRKEKLAFSADLSVSGGESVFDNLHNDEAAPARAKPPAPPRNKLLMFGLPLFLLLAAGGIIITITNKDGTKTKIELPDGAANVKVERDGKTIVNVTTEEKADSGKANATKVDAPVSGRELAKWLQSEGVEFQTTYSNGGLVKPEDPLPSKEFSIVSIILKDKASLVGKLGRLRGQPLQYIFSSPNVVSDADLQLLNSDTITGLDLCADPKGPFVTDAGLKTISRMGHLTSLNLTSLNLMGGHPITDDGLKNLEHMSSLTALSLQGSSISGRGLAYLENLQQITSLSLDKCKLEAGLISLPKLRQLKFLSLALITLSKSDMSALENQPKLSDLAIGNDKFDDAMLKNLPALPSLRSLQLGNTVVQGEGWKELARFKELTRLIINGSMYLEAADLAVLKDMPLETLALWSCPAIKDDLVKQAGNLSNLKQLSLGDTGMTPAGVQALAKALPNCKIETLGSK